MFLNSEYVQTNSGTQIVQLLMNKYEAYFSNSLNTKSFWFNHLHFNDSD